MNGPLVFRLDDIELHIGRDPLSVFASHRQTSFLHSEAGGQLFGRAGQRRWNITHATGPDLRDRRCRNRFVPDRERERRDIAEFYARGFDYLGDWHTHPQNSPEPSPRDLTSIDEIVRQSTHDMPGFLLCVVGRHAPPKGLWLSLHRVDGSAVRALPASDRPAAARGPASYGSVAADE